MTEDVVYIIVSAKMGMMETDNHARSKVWASFKHGSILPVPMFPPGNPWNKSSPSGQEISGEWLGAVLSPGVEGVGANLKQSVFIHSKL